MDNSIHIGRKGTYLHYLDNAFYFLFGTFIFFQTISNSSITNLSFFSLLFQISDYSLVVLSVIMIFSARYSKGELSTMVLFFLILLPNTVFIGNLDYLRYFFIVLATKSVDIIKILKIAVVFSIFGAISVVLCSSMGIIPNLRFIRNGIYRYGYGFIHPLVLPNIYLHCVNIYIFLQKKKFSLINALVILILFYPIYILSNARMVSISLILMCLLLLVSKYFSKNNRELYAKFLKRIILIVFSILFLSSIFLAINYSSYSSVMVDLDNIFSSRLSMWHYYWSSYPVSIFGSQLDSYILLNGMSLSDQHYVLDNSFLSLILARGVLLTSALLFYYYAIINKLVKMKNINALIILLCIIISGFSANSLIGIDRNMFIYFGWFLFDRSYNDNMEVELKNNTNFEKSERKKNASN